MIGRLLLYLVSKLTLLLFTLIGDRVMMMDEHCVGRDISTIDSNYDDDDIDDDFIDDYDDIIDDAAAVAIESLKLLPSPVRLLDSIIVDVLAPPDMLSSEAIFVEETDEHDDDDRVVFAVDVYV
jgi:hypothetical protein